MNLRLYKKTLNLSLLSLFLATLTVQQASIRDGLIHFFPFHENLDNYHDSTAHATPGNGGYTVQKTTGRSPSSNKALKFPNDVNPYTIKLPNETMNGINSFTVMLWVNFEVFQTHSCFLSVARSGAGRDNEFLFCHNIVDLNMYSSSPHADRLDITSPPTQTGTWMHIAYARNKATGNVQYFINGSLHQSGTGYSTESLVADGVHFGGDQDSVNGGFTTANNLQGSFSDFRIYNKVKTAAEITEIMNFVYDPVSNGLEHFYPFRLDLEDKVGGAHGSNYSIKKASDRLNKADRAMKFNNDGTTDTVQIPASTMNNRMSFTVSFWINIENYSSEPCYFSVANSSTFNEVVIGQKLFHLKLTSTGATGGTDLSPYSTATNTWVHIAVSRDADTGKIYYFGDGTLFKQFSGFDTTAVISEAVFFGNDQDSLGGNFGTNNQLYGSFQDLRIYDGIKNDREIQDIMEQIDCLSTEFSDNSDPYLCIDCSYPCLRCTSPTDCLECKTSPNRNNNSECKCNDTFYDDNTQCDTCEYPCENCETTSTTCKTCKGNMTQRFNDSTCACNNGYYDKQDSSTLIYSCTQCPKKFVLCSAENTGTQCKGLRRKTHTDNCDCLDNHYEDPDSSVDDCHACVYPCLTCEINSTNCLSCKGNMTQRINDTTCACNNGYYDKQDTSTSIYSCLQCHKKFALCSAENTGTQCKGQRRKTHTDNCDCLDNHFEDPDSSIDDCHPCVYPCLTCETSSTNCLSCKGNMTQRINDDTCACNDRYYDKQDISTSIYSCTLCPEKFAKCSSETTGSECRGSNRKSPSDNCVCLDNHYEDPSTENCFPCVYPCLTCETSSTNCLSCKGTATQRINDDTCACNDRYYDKQDSSTLIYSCTLCPEKFAKCTSETTGSECRGLQRKAPANNCDCNDGFYESPSNEDCIPCVYPCSHCTSETVCSNCEGNMPNRKTDNSCKCETGYYDKETTGQYDCIKCHKRYSECSALNTGITCQGLNRKTLTDQCQCNTGFYEDTDPTIINCQQCSYKCGTCLSGSACETCANSLRLKTKNNCECQNTYYSLPNDPTCNPCQHPCVNCSSDTSCDTCIAGPNRNSAPNCKCQDGFYEKPVTFECLDCQIQCQTCSNASTCLTCKPGPNRLGISENCQCKPGYFEDNGTCTQCDNTVCGTCSGTATNCGITCGSTCTKCNPEGHCSLCRLGQFIQDNICRSCSGKCELCDLNNNDQCLICNKIAKNRHQTIENNCACLDGFYQIGENLDCTKCPVENCSQCNSEGVCEVCSDSNLLPPKCEKNKKGFFVLNTEDPNNSLTGICNSKCEICEISAENCTQCQLQPNRSTLFPQCECLPGFHDNQGQLSECVPCPKGCKTCLSDEKCTECEENTNINLNNFSGQCECKPGFKLNFQTFECQKCYQYSGRCVEQCPQNTILNEEIKTCTEKNYSQSQYSSLVWIGCAIVLFTSVFMNLLKCNLAKKLKATYNQNEDRISAFNNSKQQVDYNSQSNI